MTERKVSIIIPLYNVEKYISSCLESVLQQTFTQFEVIVVNDGSTDSSANIVREIAERDPRVRLISQINSGVSAARNRGLADASGEFVVFVDADDYIAPDFLEYFLNLCRQSDADFCLSENAFTHIGEKQIEQDNIRILSPERAVALLLSPRVIVGCWNKIYKREFLKKNGITFSTTLFYGEGLNFITRAADKANRICVGDRKVYYYRRNNEMSATSKFSIEKMRNGDRALDLIKKQISVSTSLIDEMFMLHKGMFALGAITKIINSGKNHEYSEDFKKWKKTLGKSARTLLFRKNVSLYRKCLLWGGVICPSLMAHLDLKRRKKIAENSFH